MQPLQVHLPPAALEFIRKQIDSGRFVTPSDYLLALVDADCQKQAWDGLEEQIALGMASGAPRLATPEFWEEKRRQLQKRFAGAGSP